MHGIMFWKQGQAWSWSGPEDPQQHHVHSIPQCSGKYWQFWRIFNFWRQILHLLVIFVCTTNPQWLKHSIYSGLEKSFFVLWQSNVVQPSGYSMMIQSTLGSFDIGVLPGLHGQHQFLSMHWGLDSKFGFEISHAHFGQNKLIIAATRTEPNQCKFGTPAFWATMLEKIL